MRAALAARKRDNFALGQVLAAVCRAEAESALEDDQQLLALHVVVENHRVAGLEPVQAGADMLSTRALCEPHCP